MSAPVAPTKAPASLRRWLRPLARVAAVGLLLAIPSAIGVWLLVSGTAWGRAELLARSLRAINRELSGELRVESLSTLGLEHLELRGSRLMDPAGQAAARLTTLRAEWSLVELLLGRVVLHEIHLSGLYLDLSEPEGPGMGLLAAIELRKPTEQPPAEQQSSTRSLRLSHIQCERGVVGLPRVEPIGGLTLRELSFEASAEFDGTLEAELSRLELEVYRGKERLGAVSPLRARLARVGESSLQAQAKLLGSSLELSGKADLQAAAAALQGSPPGLPPRPLELHLELAGLRGKGLAQLAQDPSLASAFQGALDLSLAVSGPVNDLILSARLKTPGGATEWGAALKNRTKLSGRLQTRGLRLAQLREGLPNEPLSLIAFARADLSDPRQVPLSVELSQARLGGQRLPTLKAHATVGGAGVRDAELSLARGRSSLQVAGGSRVDGSLRAHLQGTLQTAELSSLAELAGQHLSAGTVQLKGRVERTPAEALSMNASLKAVGLAVADLSLQHAELALNARGPLAALGGRVSASVQSLGVGTTELQSASLTIEGTAPDYSVNLEVRTEEAQGQLALSVNRDRNRLTLQGNGEALTPAAPIALRVAPTRLTLPRGGEAMRIDTEGLQLKLAGEPLQLRGRLSEREILLSLSSGALELSALQSVLGWPEPLAGRIRLAGKISGAPSAPRASVQVRGSELAYSQASPANLWLDAQLDAEAGQLEVKSRVSGVETSQGGPQSLRIDLEGNARFEGGRGWLERAAQGQLDLRLSTPELSLADAAAWLRQPLLVKGSLGLELRVLGSIRDPAVEASLRGQLGLGESNPLMRLQSGATYRAGKLQLDLNLKDQQGPWLSANARLRLPDALARDLTSMGQRVRSLADTSQWSLQVALEPRALSEWPLALEELPAALRLSGKAGVAHLPGQEPEGNLQLLVAGFESDPQWACGEPTVPLNIQASWAQGGWSIRAEQARQGLATARLGARLDLALQRLLSGEAPGPDLLNLSVEVQQLDLAKIPKLCQLARGKIQGSVQLREPLGVDPQLGLALSGKQVALGTGPAVDISAGLAIDRARARAGVRVSAPQGRSELRGQLPINWSSGVLSLATEAPVEARARLSHLPLASLVPNGEVVSQVNGKLDGELGLSGSLTRPSVVGELSLSDAAFTATQLAQPLNHVSARLQLEGPSLTLESFEAQDQDGVVRMSGRVELGQPIGSAVTHAELSLVAEDLPLRQRGQVVATTSLSAEVRAEMAPLRTDVQLTLKDADTWLESKPLRSGMPLQPHPDYAMDGAPTQAELQQALPATERSNRLRSRPGPRQAPAGSPAPITELRLNARDPLWIKRRDFAFRLTAQLVATLQGEQARVVGRVALDRGYLDLLGQIFEIEKGSQLQFIGSAKPDPLVDLRARSRGKAGQSVEVAISGRASDPKLQFFLGSSPASAGEAVQALVPGSRAAQKNSAGAQAASVLGGLTAGLLATSARRELGAAAPVLMIEPGDKSGEGRVRAGFELDWLIPPFLEHVVTGAYLEGIAAKQSDASGTSSTQAGALLELYFPHSLYTAGQWGPGTTWSLDFGWEP